jgi:endonuclease/exonuclease/phosphatase family metal-dependent hydrolase
MHTSTISRVLFILSVAGTLMLAGSIARGAAPSAVRLKVMSCNILEDANPPSASTNAWLYTAGSGRRDRLVRVVADEAPDIACLQEAETNQVFDITHTNALSAYAWFGFGRDDGHSLGQHEFVLYRTDRFQQQGSGVFWLSLTPDTPGSQYAGTAKVRIAVWGRLLDRWTGRTYLVMCTHWDYQSAPARLYSAQLIRERIATLASNSLVILAGDLNMDPTDNAYPALLGTADPRSLQIRDSYRQAIPLEGANERTSHNFTGSTAGKRIDFIFHTGEFTTTTGTIVHTTYDGGRYPSDHYPVTATMNVAPDQPAMLGAAPDGGALELAWSSASGLPYRVRCSTNLQSWQDALPEAGDWIATGATSRCSIAIPQDAMHGFYRVILRTQP